MNLREWDSFELGLAFADLRTLLRDHAGRIARATVVCWKVITHVFAIRDAIS